MFVSNGALVLKTPQPSYALTSDFFPYMPGMSGSWPTAYGQMYRSQLWVSVMVQKLAKATARLPLPVYQRTPDEGRDRAPDHPMAGLLAAPNPGMSGHDLWTWTTSTFNIYGEAYWLKRRKGGTVVGLYPLHPAYLQYDPKAETWRFDSGQYTLEGIAERDLVPFRAYNPDSYVRGMSPLEPLRATMENEWNARNATSSFWLRGARPGVALKHPGNLSPEAQGRLKAQWEGLAAGSGNTGATVVLEEGMAPERLDLSAEEAQYIQTRKLNREEVCAAYDIPPPVVHILDHATFSNVTEQMRSMYRDTMAPRLKAMEAALELHLRREEWPTDDVYAEFLMDEVLRGDFEARQQALATASHMTIAEKRRIENLPFIEGTDRIFLNTATMPLDAIDAQSAAIVAGTVAPPPAPLQLARGATPVESKAAPPPDHVEEARAVLAEFFTRQGAALEGGQAWSQERWDAELADELEAVSTLVASAVGRQTLEGLGMPPSAFSLPRAKAWLRANAERTASNINLQTGDDLRAARESGEPGAVPALFAGYTVGRAAQIAQTAATRLAGFASVEAVKQQGEPATKTWVAGGNARPSHVEMDGETVELDDTFSNGALWPGDASLDIDETAGCNCMLEINSGSRGISRGGARSAMGRLSWQRSLDQIDAQKLVEGLNGDSAPILRALSAELSQGGSVPALRRRIRALSRS